MFSIAGGSGSPTFTGEVSDDGATLVGSFTQGSASFPFELKRVEEGAVLPSPPRPQDPRRPFPYDDEEVTYRNEGAGISLAGTLTLPRTLGPFPAVILITPGGPQDRDATVMGHKRFLVLADYLTRRGLAVLRVDDRGVGGSGGGGMANTAADLTGDILAGVEFLVRRSEIDSGKIGLIGHSAGAMVAPLAANRSSEVSFIVMMAGIAVDREVLQDLQWKYSGASDEAIARDRAIHSRIFEVVREESDVPVAKRLAEIRSELLQIAADAGVNAAMAGPNIDRLLVAYATPAFRYGLLFDPQSVLAAVKVPVLAIYCEKDRQVAPSENLAAIEIALEMSGNPDYTLETLPGLNHMFQTSQTGSPAEYGSIEETIAPSALTLIGDWIDSRVQ